MEEYEEMGNEASDAFDAPDAPATTTTPRERKQEGLGQSGQMVTWVEAESEINGVGSLGILKATSGNAQLLERGNPPKQSSSQSKNAKRKKSR